MLDLVDTPKRMVELSPLGTRLVKATPAERHRLWRDALLTLTIFKELADVLGRAPGRRVDRDFVLEEIVLKMPSENYERIFHTLVGWGRFGNLFGYDEVREELSAPGDQEPGLKTSG
jgi:NitT/TauT family transport system ATP-binding protein